MCQVRVLRGLHLPPTCPEVIPVLWSLLLGPADRGHQARGVKSTNAGPDCLGVTLALLPPSCVT